MWSELRADAVRRELRSLAGAGLEADELQANAAAVVGRVVPHDASCWASVDPASNVLTGSVTLHFDPGPELKRHFAEVEAAGEDLNTFGSLIAAGRSVARLSDAGAAAIDTSPRLAEIYRPLGFGRELRAVLSIDGTCWGIAELLRGDGSSDFSDQEVEFLGSAAPLIARGLRAAMLRVRVGEHQVPGPAVLVVGEAGAVVASTALAAERLAQLSPNAKDHLVPALQSVLAAVRVQRIDRAYARLRDSAGSWVTVTASPLQSASGETQIAVTLEPTGKSDIAELRLSAYGLSAREIEVCEQVLAGRSTAEIAAALFISANTVQDHLKSIFDKTGIRSRRALVAQLGGEPM
jgi:DNA-binding CsgD family transcriptional regulator